MGARIENLGKNEKGSTCPLWKQGESQPHIWGSQSGAQDREVSRLGDKQPRAKECP